jgi:hypothetical protein
MPEFLTIEEAKTYQLSTGATVDLIAMIAAGRPAEGYTKAESVDEFQVGQIVYVNALSNWRRGVVTKIGKTRVNVALTTESSVAEFLAGKIKGARIQNSPYYAVDVLVETGADAAEVAEELAAEVEGHRVEIDEAHRLPRQDAPDEELTVAEDVDRAEAHAVAELEAAEACQVARTGSAIVTALEALWTAIRANHPELPGVVMVTGTGLIGPARWGHFRRNGWEERSHEEHQDGAEIIRHGEMFVGGETLAAGALKTLETVLHEAAHVLAAARGAQDTSRQGRWHNGTFRKIAEELGLEYPHEKADGKIGFSAVVLSPGTADDYATAVTELDAAIGLVVELPAWLKGDGGAAGAAGGGEHIHHGGRAPRDPNAKKSNSNNVKATCECPEPRIIRVSKAVLAGAAIRCDECQEMFLDRSLLEDLDDEE